MVKVWKRLGARIIVEMTAGLFAALGVLVALLEREQSGEGRVSSLRSWKRRSSRSISRPRAG